MVDKVLNTKTYLRGEEVTINSKCAKIDVMVNTA